MITLAIARKSIKLFLRNFMMIPVLVAMPVFQIYLLSVVMGGAEEAVVESHGFVELVLLQTAASLDPSQFFAASMTVVFLLITGMTAAVGIIEERENKTLARTLAAPVSRGQIIVGNLIGQVMFSFVIGALIIAVTHFALGINWGTSPLLLFLVTLTVIYVAVALGFVFVGIFRDSKTASGVTSFSVIAMAFLSDGMTGGSLTDGGPFVLTRNFTLNKWAYEAYIGVMESRPFNEYSLNLGILAAVGTALAVVAIILFGKENIHE